MSRYLDKKTREEIAARHGVKTYRQVWNVLRGKSKNYPLLKELTEAMEKNKQLMEKAQLLSK